MFARHIPSEHPKTNVAAVPPRVFAGLFPPVIPDGVVVLPVGAKSLHPQSVLAELLAVCPGLGTPSAELQYVRLESLLVGKNLLVKLLRSPPIFPIVSSSFGRRLIGILRRGRRRAHSHCQRSGQSSG